MKLRLKFVIPAVAAVAAAVAGVVAYRRRAPQPTFKTIADISPPRFRPGMDTPDPSKMRSLLHADTTEYRQKLVAHAPLQGGRETPRESASFDCPAAAGL